MSYLYRVFYISCIHPNLSPHKCFVISRSKSVFGIAPILRSISLPFLNINNVGILMILYSLIIFSFSSVFNLPNTIFPLWSAASSSMIGATITQGPHQGAQQSTIKIGYLCTTSLKFSSVTSIGFSGQPLSSVILSPH